jgi:hypothetical protein
MVAATYIVRGVQNAAPGAAVHLFEGFVSYKERGIKSDHKRDVILLREVVLNPKQFGDCIISADRLRLDQYDRLVSAFDVAGLNCGSPAVIKRQISP